ncbi:spermatogenesis-associated serine-rich protein 1 [Biomphalaria pfeifferi]|uniref:Spermatogenesis-associated serine-rich protein 1 n=1 Tax=Biomphalaria pfeifferi TaxID=112525 RepID=A0AAD8AY51_BIOPF|nr:spermatogenesis-associated serine-rich protein 1 [Biomphalaria pfeifferi]
MLHVITEVGKPGRQEREKRHYPDAHNQPGLILPIKPRGRRYIPHDSGREPEWKPHNQNINIVYSDVGPDWSSRLKYIPHPENPEYPAAEIWPDNWKGMRPYPFTYKRSEDEWLFDPGHKKPSLRCVFEGVHKATAVSENSFSHEMLYGKGRNEEIIDKRNSIPEASPGDKSYQVPEYSPNFHKTENYLPKFSTGTSPYSPTLKRKADTFVPLMTFRPVKKETFRQRTEVLQKKMEMEEVKKLDSWQPAKPIASTIPQLDPSEVPKKY